MFFYTPAIQPASHIHPAARAKPSCFKDGIVLFGISGTTASFEVCTSARVYWHIGKHQPLTTVTCFDNASRSVSPSTPLTNKTLFTYMSSQISLMQYEWLTDVRNRCREKVLCCVLYFVTDQRHDMNDSRLQLGVRTFTRLPKKEMTYVGKQYT